MGLGIRIGIIWAWMDRMLSWSITCLSTQSLGCRELSVICHKVVLLLMSSCFISLTLYFLYWILVVFEWSCDVDKVMCIAFRRLGCIQLFDQLSDCVYQHRMQAQTAAGIGKRLFEERVAEWVHLDWQSACGILLIIDANETSCSVSLAHQVRFDGTTILLQWSEMEAKFKAINLRSTYPTLSEIISKCTWVYFPGELLFLGRQVYVVWLEMVQAFQLVHLVAMYMSQLWMA